MTEWIKCSEKLPEESGYVLVYNPYIGVHMMSYSSKYRTFNCSDESDDNRIDDNTYWMPLPDAPEVEECGSD